VLISITGSGPAGLGIATAVLAAALILLITSRRRRRRVLHAAHSHAVPHPQAS
jgi:MYXO-CTERM domain-containing protein